MRTIRRTMGGFRAVAGLCALLAGGVLAAFGAGEAYMVVDLATGGVTYEDGTPTDYTNDVYKTTKMVFRKVPAGTYAVQNGNVQATMAKDFYVGIYEVTVGQFKLMQDPAAAVAATAANMKPKASSYNAVRGTRDAAAKPTDTSPIGKLAALVRAGGVSGLFDLPTEAMWEVAARAMPAGDDSHASWPWSFGTSSSTLGDYAWYLGNAGGASHVVGLKKPNAWGFYDMYGNVSEWCRDHWSWANFVPTQAGNTTDTGYNRSLRGGTYESGGNDCSSSGRLNAYYTSSETSYGFRLSMVSDESSSEVNLDIDNDGQPDVIITIPDDGDNPGTIVDNGDGSYDVTGAAQIELPAADGVIDVPTNVTVTVGADGTTSLDAGETVTLTIDNGDGTTTITTINGPAEIAPDGTVTLGDGDDIGDVFTDGDDGGEPGEPLHWTSGGDASWFAQDIVVYDGTHAMQSGTVTNNFEASEWIATDIKGRGTLSWAWKTSCQPVDAQGYGAMCYLELTKDGVTEVRSRLTGETDWTVQSIDLDGEYSVRFVYQKVRVTDAGYRDAAWVDSVKWVLDEDYKALEEAFDGNADITYDPESGTWVVSVTNDITGPVVVPDVEAIEIRLDGNTIAGPDGDAAGNAAAPDGLPAIMLEGTNTTLSITGAGTVSGGDGADETLGEDGHAAGNGAPAIAVPDGFTGTVTAGSGVTVTGGSGGNAAPARLSGPVRITEWRPLGGGNWRLVFTVPESALKGSAANLVPDRSFSVKHATQLGLFENGGTPGAGEASGSLAFTIDSASVQGGTLTVALTVPVAVQASPCSLFVRIVEPIDP